MASRRKIIAVAVVVVAVVGSGCRSADKPKSAATTTTQPAKTPAGFVEFRDEQAGFAISYPTAWTRLQSTDPSVVLVTRDGPFAAGTTGTMKFKGQRPLAYRLVKVEPLREFVDETPVGELVVRVSHLLEPLPTGRVRITYSAEINGSEDEARQLGPMITQDFPETMGSLVKLAKERSR